MSILSLFEAAPRIQMLWIGSELSNLEKICINSFLAHGHAVDLYVYEDVKGVPGKARVKDGTAILPREMIFQYRDHKSPSAFSNYFRYKLLSDKGGYWCDADQVCLKRFDFKEAYVFASEEFLPEERGEQQANVNVIKAPKHSALMRHNFEVCLKQDKNTLVWGQMGPKLMTDSVSRFKLRQHQKRFNVFCPIPFWESHRFRSEEPLTFGDETYGVHLWHEMWRRDNIDKNGTFAKGSYFEILKNQYL